MDSYQFIDFNDLLSKRNNINYELKICQQPIHSRSCGTGQKVDRRPIDPPPVIQLKISDSSTPGKYSQLFNPYLFIHATLLSASTSEELVLLRDGKTRTTSGSVVCSMQRLRDLDNVVGAFFVFGDLSVRLEGNYRLKFVLHEIINSELIRCDQVISDVFSVYAPKKFPGMMESTALSRCFAEQGLKIRARKIIKAKGEMNDIDKRKRFEEFAYSAHYPTIPDESIADNANIIKRRRQSVNPNSALLTPDGAYYMDPRGFYYPQQMQYQQSPEIYGNHQGYQRPPPYGFYPPPPGNSSAVHSNINYQNDHITNNSQRTSMPSPWNNLSQNPAGTNAVPYSGQFDGKMSTALPLSDLQMLPKPISQGKDLFNSPMNPSLARTETISAEGLSSQTPVSTTSSNLSIPENLTQQGMSAIENPSLTLKVGDSNINATSISETEISGEKDIPVSHSKESQDSQSNDLTFASHKPGNPINMASPMHEQGNSGAHQSPVQYKKHDDKYSNHAGHYQMQGGQYPMPGGQYPTQGFPYISHRSQNPNTGPMQGNYPMQGVPYPIQRNQHPMHGAYYPMQGNYAIPPQMPHHIQNFPHQRPPPLSKGGFPPYSITDRNGNYQLLVRGRPVLMRPKLSIPPISTDRNLILQRNSPQSAKSSGSGSASVTGMLSSEYAYNSGSGSSANSADPTMSRLGKVIPGPVIEKNTNHILPLPLRSQHDNNSVYSSFESVAGIKRSSRQQYMESTSGILNRDVINDLSNEHREKRTKDDEEAKEVLVKVESD